MAQLKFFTSPVTSHQQKEQRVIRGGIQKLKKGEKEKDRRRRERKKRKVEAKEEGWRTSSNFKLCENKEFFE